MNKQNIEKELRGELEVLNNIIDTKIIRGLSYAKESRRHRLILSSLSHIKRTQSVSNWFTKSLSTFSII